MGKLVKKKKLVGPVKTGKRYRSAPVRKLFPTTKLHSDAGAADFESMLPNGWSAEYKGVVVEPFRGPRMRFKRVVIRAKSGVYINLYLLEHSDFIELEGIFIDKHKGLGHGTAVMGALKRYADAKNKGIIIRDVSNEAFFNRFSWLHKSPDPLSDYGANPIYVYNISWRKAEPLVEIPEEKK